MQLPELSQISDEQKSCLYQAIEAHKEMQILASERREALQEAERVRQEANQTSLDVIFDNLHRINRSISSVLGRIKFRNRHRPSTNTIALPGGISGQPVNPRVSPTAASSRSRYAHLLPLAQPVPQRNPRILLDVTEAASETDVTGIPRVVREIAKEAFSAGEAVPVIFNEGAFWTVCDGFSEQEKIYFKPGDILFIPANPIRHLNKYHEIIRRIKMERVLFVVLLHDIIPLTHPTTCYEGIPSAFLRWFTFVAANADLVVTPSAAEAATIGAFIGSSPAAEVPQIAWSPWASSLPIPTKAPSDAVANALAGGRCFLMVGSLEPRKGHTVALDAFDRLWQRGVDVKLLIISRIGWGTRHVELRIRTHTLFGRSLLWEQNVDDDDLAHAYIACAALISPSLAEGFGLPVVEAASFGTHRILSDIQVFREVAGGENVTFFPLCDAEKLAAAIEDTPARIRASGERSLPEMNWRGATSKLFELIRERTRVAL